MRFQQEGQQQRPPAPVPQPHPTPTQQPQQPQVQQVERPQEVAPTQNTGEYHQVTKEQVRQIMPYQWNTSRIRNPVRRAAVERKLEDYTRRLNETMQRFQINTPLKQAMFLATVAQESGEMRLLEEQPSSYPSSRSKYKGRGLIQLTDTNESRPDNYRAASRYFGQGDLFVERPELVATEEYAFVTAGWYWSVRESGQYGETPNSRIGDSPRADLMDFLVATADVRGVLCRVFAGGAGNDGGRDGAK